MSTADDRAAGSPEPSDAAEPPIFKPPVGAPRPKPDPEQPGAPSADVRAPAGPPSPAPPTSTEAPTPEVEAVAEESVMPGGHRGGFQRLPTGPVGITSQTAPADPDGEQTAPLVQWALPEPQRPRGFLAGWALGFAIVGLIVSLFVGWGFPLGIAGVVAGILALRRPLESRSIAVWAIVLGAVSILYSAGWLLFAAVAAGVVG